MSRTIAVVYVLGLFLLGILIGASAMHLFYAMRFPPPPSIAMGIGPGPGQEGGRWRGAGPSGREIERMLRGLDLTDEQRERIDQILDEGRREADALRAEMAPRVRAHMRQMHERISEVLTEEQRRQFRPRRRD
jgi:Spy/CpxP family protein refolding chaperone